MARNLRSDGSFRASRTLGRETRGESIGLAGEADVAVGGAGAHLRAVGGQPGDFVAGVQAGLGEHLAEHEDALPAEAGDLDAQIELAAWRGGRAASRRPMPFTSVEEARAGRRARAAVRGRDVPARLWCGRGDCRARRPPASLVRTKLLRFHGLHLPDGGAGRKHFDEARSRGL